MSKSNRSKKRWVNGFALIVICFVGIYLARDSLLPGLADRRPVPDGALMALVADCRNSPQQTDEQGATVRAQCLAIAEADPNSLSGISASLFVADTWRRTPEGSDAFDHLANQAAIAPAETWASALNAIRPKNDRDYWKPLAQELLTRLSGDSAQTDGDLLLNEITLLVRSGDDEATASAEFTEAANLIVGDYSASPRIDVFCELIGRVGDHPPPKWGIGFESHLQKVLKTNTDRFVRCSAKYSLAKVIYSQGISRQAEALSHFEDFCAEFDGSVASRGEGIEENNRLASQRMAEAIRSHGLGMPAPNCRGIDLDGQPIAMADFHGKVVLVTFWASWCSPCLEAIGHEKALLARFGDKRFAIVGFNGDHDLSAARDAAAKHQISWLSFQQKNEAKLLLADEWHIAGYPSFFLLNEEGIVQRSWLGLPDDDEIGTAVAQLLGETSPSHVETKPPGEPHVGLTDSPITFVTDSPEGRGFVAKTLNRDDEASHKYVVFVPTGYDASSANPAILFLHGHGVQGTDGRQHITALADSVNRMSDSFPMFVIFPQAPEGNWRCDTGHGQLALDILDEVVRDYHIDTDRIALTGVSMGGEATWHLAAEHPERWSALMPICASGDVSTASQISQIPCWCFQGALDRSTNASEARKMVRAILRAGGTPIYTEFPGLGHECWDAAYSKPELYEWLLQQRRKTPEKSAN